MGERTSLSLPGARSGVGKYELVAKLGSGGQAEVFLAAMRGLVGFNKLVVVKRLRATIADQPTFVEMFLDEARLSARLNHPNIVHTYEVGESAGAYFIAMEYLEGQPLSKVVRRANRSGGTPLKDSVCARIVSDGLAGLHHAHELRDYDGTPLQIVHRDVSPQNLLVTYEGTVKLVDFGVAKATVNNVVTETGALKGKVAYMSPEQVRGNPDRRTDVFAMGVVLWEALARRRLFEGEPVAILHKLMVDTAPLPTLALVRPDIDAALLMIVARALERDPDDRYSTADEMRQDLEKYLEGLGEEGRSIAVGAMMASTFAQAREETRQRIQDAMAMRSESGTTSSTSAPVIQSASGARSLPSQRVSVPLPSAPPSSVRSGRASLPRVAEAPGSSGAVLPTTRAEVAARARRQEAPTLDAETADDEKPEGSTQFSLPSVQVRRLPSVPVPIPRWRRFWVVGVAGFLGALVTSWVLTRPDPGAARPPAPVTAAATPHTETFQLVSDPPGAVVTESGRPLGKTPLLLDLEAGVHTLALTLEGYDEQSFSLRAVAGNPATSHTVRLTPRAPATPAVTNDASAGGGAAVANTHAHGAPHARPVTAPPAQPARSRTAPTAATTQAAKPGGPKIRLIDDEPRGKIDVIGE